MGFGCSASYSLAFRIRLPRRPGMLGRVIGALGAAGGDVDAVEVTAQTRDWVERRIVVDATGAEHQRKLLEAVKGVPDLEFVGADDCTFAEHEGGKLETGLKRPLRCAADLTKAYTPGVARVCLAIHAEPRLGKRYTIRKNTVAVISDGTAVLGLGDIGPQAAMPVMEGKAVLFKSFGGVDAFPICLDTKDPDEIVAAVKALAPTFGGINLEDISAPRCFEIEERLKRELDIPVFHDDQHGTAVVSLAALTNALKLVGKKLADLKIVVAGVGAAGVACSKLLLTAGARNLIGCDRKGTIYRGRTENMNPAKEWYAEHTNPEGVRGSLADAIRGADMFLGVSGPGIMSVADVRAMARDAIVFAMSNPVPEIAPEDAGPHVAVMATGRSDYPNQINNVLAFPGIFRGALDCNASDITVGMCLAAAEAIAGLVTEDELRSDYIIPGPFNPQVAPTVAAAVRRRAETEGVARELPTALPEALNFLE